MAVAPPFLNVVVVVLWERTRSQANAGLLPALGMTIFLWMRRPWWSIVGQENFCFFCFLFQCLATLPYLSFSDESPKSHFCHESNTESDNSCLLKLALLYQWECMRTFGYRRGARGTPAPLAGLTSRQWVESIFLWWFLFYFTYLFF